jgi:hypothetical protein
MAHVGGLVLVGTGLGLAGFSLYHLLAGKKVDGGSVKAKSAAANPAAVPALSTAAAATSAGFDLTPCASHGAYKSNAACVTAYQGALDYLSTALAKPAWAVLATGKLDSATTAAVKAFQADNPPLKVDGEAGKDTTEKMGALLAANPAPATAPAPTSTTTAPTADVSTTVATS